VKLFKFGLNLWIMLTSVFSFLAGWIMIAHAPKPVQKVVSSSIVVTPYPTLAPLPDLGAGNDLNSGNSFPSTNFSLQPTINNLANAPMPAFRTGGS
jgi:hypothetical protein